MRVCRQAVRLTVSSSAWRMTCPLVVIGGEVNHHRSEYLKHPDRD